MADDLKFLDTRGDEIVNKFKLGAHGDLVPKDIDFFQTLKNLKEERDIKEEKNQQTKAVWLDKKFQSATTLNELLNIQPSLAEHNEDTISSGNEQYSINYGEKLQLFKNAELAYERLKNIQDENIQNVDKLASQLISGGWEGASEKMLEMYKFEDTINQAKKYGFVYKGEDLYTQTSLDKALKTRKGAYGSVMEILDDNNAAFKMMNPDGSVNENSRMLFDKLKFNIATGDKTEVQNTIKTGTSDAIKNYKYNNKQYQKWAEIEMKAGLGVTKLSDMDMEKDDAYALTMEVFGQYGLDEDDELSPEWISSMKNMFLENAKNANNQHKVYNGVLYDENPIWKRMDVDPGEIDGYTVRNLDDLNKDAGDDPLKKEILDTSELKIEEPDVVTETVEEKEKVEEKIEEPAEDFTPLQEPIESRSEPRVGSLRYKEEEAKKQRLSNLSSLMPDVSLKSQGAYGNVFKEIREKERKGKESFGIMDINIESLDKDIKTISKALNNEDLVSFIWKSPLGGKGTLHDLKDLIERYEAEDTTFSPKRKIGMQIIGRYNTMLSKLKKIESK